MSLNYLLDEHIPHLLQAELLREERTLTVWRVGEPGAPPLGSPDPQILLWCARNQHVLVTNNRKSMPGHLADHLAGGGHIPGIFVISLDRSLAETVEQLVLLSIASLEDEHRDLIRYLPLDA